MRRFRKSVEQHRYTLFTRTFISDVKFNAWGDFDTPHRHRSTPSRLASSRRRSTSHAIRRHIRFVDGSTSGSVAFSSSVTSAKLVEVVTNVCSIAWHDRRTVVVGNRRKPRLPQSGDVVEGVRGNDCKALTRPRLIRTCIRCTAVGPRLCLSATQ